MHIAYILAAFCLEPIRIGGERSYKGRVANPYILPYSAGSILRNCISFHDTLPFTLRLGRPPGSTQLHSTSLSLLFPPFPSLPFPPSSLGSPTSETQQKRNQNSRKSSGQRPGSLGFASSQSGREKYSRVKWRPLRRSWLEKAKRNGPKNTTEQTRNSSLRFIEDKDSLLLRLFRRRLGYTSFILFFWLYIYICLTYSSAFCR